jgi:hypothetical protein
MSATFWCPENGGCERCDPAIMAVCRKKVVAICPTCGGTMVHPNAVASGKAIDAGGCRPCRIKAKWSRMASVARQAALEFWLREEDEIALGVICEIDPAALTMALAASPEVLSKAVQEFVWDEIGRSAEGRLNGVGVEDNTVPMVA